MDRPVRIRLLIYGRFARQNFSIGLVYVATPFLRKSISLGGR